MLSLYFSYMLPIVENGAVILVLSLLRGCSKQITLLPWVFHKLREYNNALLRSIDLFSIFTIILFFSNDTCWLCFKSKLPMKNTIIKIIWFTDNGQLARIWLEFIHIPTALLWRFAICAHTSWHHCGQVSVISCVKSCP
jgi:hypothetical protein